MPLALTALHLYFADRRPRWLILFGVSWLMQALACGYYLFYLSTLIALWLIWFAVGRERWSHIARVIAMWGVAALAMAPDRLRLPEVPACVWLAPLAGGDRVFQCRHRQRAQGVRLALDLGLARRRRASGVGAVSGPGDRGRGAHRRHAGVGGGGPIRFRSARRVAMAARGVGGVRSGGDDAGIFRSLEDRAVRREADLGDHGPQTTVSRCTAGCRRACPSSFRPPCLAQAIAARVLHDCDGRDVAVQPRTIADADERDADLQGALRLADAVARGRGRASAGAVLGPQHLVPGGGRRPCRGADHDALAAAAHVAARSRLRARRCRSVAAPHSDVAEAGIAAGTHFFNRAAGTTDESRARCDRFLSRNGASSSHLQWIQRVLCAALLGAAGTCWINGIPPRSPGSRRWGPSKRSSITIETATGAGGPSWRRIRKHRWRIAARTTRPIASAGAYRRPPRRCRSCVAHR